MPAAPPSAPSASAAAAGKGASLSGGGKTMGLPGPVTTNRAGRAATGIFVANTGPSAGPANYTLDANGNWQPS